VAGAIFVMWLAEQITVRGMGNGALVVLVCGIVSHLPFALSTLMESVKTGDLDSHWLPCHAPDDSGGCRSRRGRRARDAMDSRSTIASAARNRRAPDADTRVSAWLSLSGAGAPISQPSHAS